MASYYVRATGGSDGNDGLSHANGWATIQHALDTMTTGQANRCNCSGSFTLSSSLSTATYGTATPDNFLLFAGYTTVEDDGGICTVDGGTNEIVNDINADAYNWERHLFKNWGTSTAFSLDNFCGWYKCEFDGEGARVSAIDADQGCIFAENKIHGMVPTASLDCVNFVSDTTVVLNYLQFDSGASSAVAINTSSTAGLILGNVISLKTTTSMRGIEIFGDNIQIIGNTVFNQSAGTGIGINLSGSAIDMGTVINNLVAGMSGAGGKGVACNANSVLYGNNKFWNNTTHESGLAGVIHNLGNNDTLGANPFKTTGQADPDDDDFEISAAALAWPAQLYNPDSNFGTRNQSYGDVGALVREYISAAPFFVRASNTLIGR